MKQLLTSVLFALSLQAFAQEFTPYYKYRVYLTDKKQSEFSIRHPEDFLSQKAIERRNRQGIKIDETDIPVCATYVNQIRNTGVKVMHTSKWNNTVVVSCTDTTVMERIAQLPFVSGTRRVAHYTKASHQPGDERKNNVIQGFGLSEGITYGSLAFDQINQLNGVALHGAGFRGQGMTIAVIDGGFFNADVIRGFENTKILGTKDFVDPTENFYATGSHGMMVLSCMGANIPNYMIGTAPEAGFWLIMSEDGDSEQLIEEDNWSAAIEFADSVGVDVINTSLGYYDFDNKADNLGYESLDGKTHICSRSASMVASKGMILCCSAGNEGNGKWKKITAPADAIDVLTVGAVDPDGSRVAFSSQGNTADGRIKPDVMATGLPSAVYSTTGSLTYSAGTSFSSPILCGMVACLWQALPNLNAYQIMDIVRKSGNRADNPDELYGYGIPDFFKAYTIGLTY